MVLEAKELFREWLFGLIFPVEKGTGWAWTSACSGFPWNRGGRSWKLTRKVPPTKPAKSGEGVLGFPGDQSKGVYIGQKGEAYQQVYIPVRAVPFFP